MTDIRIVQVDQLGAEERSAWARLQSTESGLRHPFLATELVDLVAGLQDNVEVAVLSEQGKSFGFFPYQRTGHVAQPVAQMISDMQAIMLPSNKAIDIVALLRAADLKAWHFDHLPAIQQFAQPFHRYIDDALYMDLTDGYEAYRAARLAAGSSLVKQAERKARKLAREQGELRFELHDTEEATFDQLCDWKSAALQRRGFFDVFTVDWLRELMRQVRFATAEQFRGLLSALYAGEQLVAAQLSMSNQQILSAWIPAYDPKFSKYSPGVVLQLELAKAAAEQGIEQIDLGRGQNQTKLGLGSNSVPLAVGSVDLRPIRQMLSSSWYHTRELVHATPLKGAPLRCYRRLRNLVTRA